MKQKKPILLLCLLLLTPSVSAYENIPIIGYYYEKAVDVNVHLGDNTDTNLTPSAADSLSYTNTFSLYGKPKRQEVRLVLTTVNVMPGGAKEKGIYDDVVYLNNIEIGRLNDKVAGSQQDYSPQRVEFIFSSELLNKGDNVLTITSGSNPDKTNYDDFVISSIYMEQYGKLNHWLFSYIPPDIVVIFMAGIMAILAGYSYFLNKKRKLSENYQFLLVGVLGAITGMILMIEIQDNLAGFIVLFGSVAVILTLMIGLGVLTIAKYLLHRNIPPLWFMFLTRPAIFLVLMIIFQFISYPYLYYDPGGPKPTYGVPVHRPETERE